MLSAKDNRTRQCVIVENTLGESQRWPDHASGSHHLRALDFVEKLLHGLWPSLTPVSDAYPPATVLRVFLKNVIFRSQSTHRTLLTACYYLVLFKSKHNEMQTSGPSNKTRAFQFLQSHERIFLSAFILGWKFTQDYCYTTLQWASISGFIERRNTATPFKRLGLRLQLLIKYKSFQALNLQLRDFVTPNVKNRKTRF